jgi:hypothetical protein
MVDASCDPELIGFYSRLGFTSATGVSIRRYEKQTGPGRRAAASARQRFRLAERRCTHMERRRCMEMETVLECPHP